MRQPQAVSQSHTCRRLSPTGRPSTPYSCPLASIFSQVILVYFLFLPYGVFWWEGALHLNADKFITILYSLSFCVFRYYCLLSGPESFLYFLLDVLKFCFSNFSPLIKWVVFGFASPHGLLNSQCHFLNNSSFLYRFACCLSCIKPSHTRESACGPSILFHRPICLLLG